MPTTAIEDQPPAVAVERSHAKASFWVPLAFVAVYILWGSTYIGIRIAIESFPPLAMAAVRHSLVGLILYPILRWKTGIRPTAAHWRVAAVTGVLLLCVSNGGLSWAEQRVPSGIAALLVATVSLWLVIVDWLRPGGVRPVPRVVAGLLMGFAGLALLVGPAKLGGGQRTDLLGTAVLVMVSFVWACASLYSKHRPVPESPLLVVAMQSLAGGAALWIAAVASGEFRALHFASVTTRSWMALIYLIVFGSGNRVYRVFVHFEKQHRGESGDLRIRESGGGAVSWVVAGRGADYGANGDRRGGDSYRRDCGDYRAEGHCGESCDAGARHR